MEDQPTLFPVELWGAGAELLESNAKPGRFTGERVIHDKSRYNAIVRALGHNLGINLISEVFGVSHNTVRRIYEDNTTDIDAVKQKHLRSVDFIMTMTSEALVDGLRSGEKLPIKELAYLYKVMSDSRPNLAGEANVRVEVVAGLGDRARELLEKELRAFDSLSDVKQVQVIDVQGKCDHVPGSVPEIGSDEVTGISSDTSMGASASTGAEPGACEGGGGGTGNLPPGGQASH